MGGSRLNCCSAPAALSLHAGSALCLCPLPLCSGCLAAPACATFRPCPLLCRMRLARLAWHVLACLGWPAGCSQRRICSARLLPRLQRLTAAWLAMPTHSTTSTLPCTCCPAATHAAILALPLSSVALRGPRSPLSALRRITVNPTTAAAQMASSRRSNRPLGHPPMRIPSPSVEPALFGVPLKWVSLATLVIQNSALVLVMRYARTVPGDRFIPSTAVVMSELIKLLVSLAIYIQEERKINRITSQKLFNDFFGPESDWIKMTVPAILYFIQNTLQYVAVSLLDAATFQVTYQMKIITTALFSVWLLNKSLSATKWTALGLLTIGIGIVQIPTDTAAANKGKEDLSGADRFLGLIAVMVACVLSGLAGVWFEKVLKGSKASLFLRNVQLSFFSVIPGIVFGVYLVDGAEVAEGGFFKGYTVWAWAAILCQAVGGLIVAIVVKYADNILKGFATSIAIILSSIASVFIFDFQITIIFIIGSSLVLYATHLYSKPDNNRVIVSAKSDTQYINIEAGAK
ncbi:nucleotide-sugar transporter-domain-containing protein [Entophlyctis helioformis]|nr:nucleotide-sugar transporter-domain-containing protein [Entophlyctis helioformis]